MFVQGFAFDYFKNAKKGNFKGGENLELLNPHFPNQMTRLTHIFNHPEYIPNVAGDVSANALVEEIIAHSAFPNPVKINANQLPFSVQYWTAGIAACGMIGCNKSHGNRPLCTCILLLKQIL